MLRRFCPVIWSFILQFLLCVDGIRINTSANVRHQRPNPNAVITQELALASAISWGNNSELLSSRSQNLPCPASEDISPCRCFYDSSYYYMDMNCYFVTTEAELRRVFTAYFPVPHFRRLDMMDCEFSVLETGVFGDVTFTEINIENSELQEIETGALDGMYETLESIEIMHSQTQKFPFETIGNFIKLELLRIDNDYVNDNITSFPILKSSSLKEMHVNHLNFNYMPIDALQLPAIETIHLVGSQILSFKAGTFNNLTNLRILDLDDNKLTQVPSGLFAFNGLNNLTHIRLEGNEIDKIEMNAFEAKAGVYIDVSYNNLPTIDEEVWIPLFEVGMDLLEIQNNPLLCGCDIAWIVRNPEYLAQIGQSAKCKDGENIHDLDPHIYDWC